MNMNQDPEWLKMMAALEAESASVAAGVVTATFENLTGYMPGHKRCGCFLLQRGGRGYAHLPCTRRRGHAGKHRIWVKILKKRGRKHIKWVDMQYRATFALATSK